MSDKHDPRSRTALHVLYLCPHCSAEARFRYDAADYGVEMSRERCKAAMEAWERSHFAECPATKATIRRDDEWEARDEGT